MDYTTKVEIGSDIDTVWTAVADPMLWTQWMDGVTAVKPATPATTPAYGAEYEVRQSWWKLNDQAIQIKEFDRPTRFAYSATTTGGMISVTYVLTDQQNGTVTVDTTMSMDGLFSGPFIEKQLVKESTGLRDYCERVAPQDTVR